MTVFTIFSVFSEQGRRGMEGSSDPDHGKFVSLFTTLFTIQRQGLQEHLLLGSSRKTGLLLLSEISL